MVGGKVVDLRLWNVVAVADLAQPKEGPRVEHHEGVDRDHLLTGITSCRSKLTECTASI